MPSSETLPGMLVVSILPNFILNSSINAFLSSLFLIVEQHLSWMNFCSETILTMREVWSEELCRSGRMEYVFNSSELDWRNIRSMTESESFGLSVYYVGTQLMSINSSRLNKSAISLRVSACTE